MPNFLDKNGHIVIAVVVIGAIAGLAGVHVVSGTDAVGVILAVAGFSSAGAVASSSVSSVASALPAISQSSGTQTTTITPSAHQAPHPDPNLIPTAPASSPNGS